MKDERVSRHVVQPFLQGGGGGGGWNKRAMRP